MSKITMQEEVATPSTPSSGKWSVYFKSGGLYIVDDAGNETKVSAEDVGLLTTGGTSTAYTISTPDALALTVGEIFRIKFHTTAGATPTLERDGLTAKSLKYYDNTGTKVACGATSIIANMIAEVTYDGTDFVVLDALPTGGGGGGVGKNILSNGGFRVAQRGVGPFTSATTFVNNDDSYLIDGWILLSDGNDVVDVSRVADNDFVSGYKLRADIETANKRLGFLSPVSNADMQEIRKSGKASLQFKAKCTGTSISNVRAYLLAWNGTADTITSDVVSGGSWGAAGNNPTFAANWTAENSASNIPIETTITLNTIENIDVDTASVTNLAVLIIIDDTDATVGDFFELGDVKVEKGSVCTEYQNEDYGTELFKCSFRFTIFNLAIGNAVGVGYAGGAGTSALVALVVPVPMATTPAPSLLSGTPGNYNIRANALTNAATAIALTAFKNNQAYLTFTGTVAASHVAVVYAGATDYIALTSEL
jgi:hypothetical protein